MSEAPKGHEKVGKGGSKGLQDMLQEMWLECQVQSPAQGHCVRNLAGQLQDMEGLVYLPIIELQTAPESSSINCQGHVTAQLCRQLLVMYGVVLTQA